MPAKRGVRAAPNKTTRSKGERTRRDVRVPESQRGESLSQERLIEAARTMLMLATEFELINEINGPSNATERDDYKHLWRATDTEVWLQRAVALLLHADRERRELTARVRVAPVCTELATVWKRKGAETAIGEVPRILRAHLLHNHPTIAAALVEVLSQPRQSSAASRRDALLDAAGRVVGRGLTRMKEAERYLRTGSAESAREQPEHADYMEPLHEALGLAHRAIAPAFADQLNEASDRVFSEALRAHLQRNGG